MVGAKNILDQRDDAIRRELGDVPVNGENTSDLTDEELKNLSEEDKEQYLAWKKRLSEDDLKGSDNSKRMMEKVNAFYRGNDKVKARAEAEARMRSANFEASDAQKRKFQAEAAENNKRKKSAEYREKVDAHYKGAAEESSKRVERAVKSGDWEHYSDPEGSAQTKKTLDLVKELASDTMQDDKTYRQKKQRYQSYVDSFEGKTTDGSHKGDPETARIYKAALGLADVAREDYRRKNNAKVEARGKIYNRVAMLRNSGYTISEIARSTGLPEGTISNILSSMGVVRHSFIVDKMW